jgi:hypothetical protein
MQSERVGLLKFLNDLELTELYNQLQTKPRILAAWKVRTEAQWNEYYGISGIDVYNYLHLKRVSELS